MRRSHWAVIIVLVCVLASCQSALPPATPTPELTTTASPTATFVPAPTITATNTPSPEPTATQQPTPTCASEPTSPIPQEAKEYFSEAYRLWVDETQDPSNFLMASNLISGTLAYANAMLDPATPLEAQRDALDSLSAWMRYNPYCMESYESRISQSYLSLDLFDLDGDGRSEGVFVLNHDLMVGPPMELDFVLYGDGEQYTIYPLLPLVQ
ncbi:MAG: hypothetical protein SVX38_07190, partial [Chloroflexota bacterium]|nr:hypothetical protein [Chloroflexota bacterium]